MLKTNRLWNKCYNKLEYGAIQRFQTQTNHQKFAIETTNSSISNNGPRF